MGVLRPVNHYGYIRARTRESKEGDSQTAELAESQEGDSQTVELAESQEELKTGR